MNTESPQRPIVPSSKYNIDEIEKKKILAVDDEASVLELVRAALESEGHIVDTAFDGNTALQKIREGHFDAIVSDCKMPGRSGFEIYLWCREKRPDLAERFLFLTGDVMASDSLRFMEKYKLPHLSKPFDLKNLAQSVSQLFEPVQKLHTS